MTDPRPSMSMFASPEDYQAALAEWQNRQAPVDDDFELPVKACDLGRPEGCESCQ